MVHMTEHGEATVVGVRPSGTVTFLFTDVEGSTRLWAADKDALLGRSFSPGRSGSDCGYKHTGVARDMRHGPSSVDNVTYRK